MGANKAREALARLANKETTIHGTAWRLGDYFEEAFAEIAQALSEEPRPAEKHTSVQTVLEKYMAYIRDVEGTDYITTHERREMSGVVFEQPEWDLLEALAEKARRQPITDK